ncbi:Hypothetical predicted protein [Paramuricea clavata]|uniref:Uncharacterized protein n=1 Tax=Paramuricea clavata TaxID=317549 RepID=A0A7D9HAK8_PARCT|nr:Hypothetical predicted protein [Paramuricea clavata]
MVNKLCPETTALIRLYKNETELKYRKIAARCGVSKSAVHKKCNTKLRRKLVPKISNGRVGRPRCLNERDERSLLQAVKTLQKTSVNFSVKDVIQESGLDPSIAKRRTISLYLNRAGYHHLQARKKGLLSESDKKIRTKYARNAKKLLKDSPKFYTHDISFYLDGVSFVHKYNALKTALQPKSHVWSKQGEGLEITSKGSNDLPGGRRLHLMVAVAYGKGVILRKAYEKIDGSFFAGFVKENLNLCFAKAGPRRGRQCIFVMDKIPARSPDLNPIENIFHVVKKQLEEEAINMRLSKESFQNFHDRVCHCLDNLSVDLVDWTLETMSNRITAILRKKGIRSKY